MSNFDEYSFSFLDEAAAWKAGQKAAQENRPRAHNPYDAAPLADAWDEGYEAALRSKDMEARMRRLHEEFGEDW